MTPENPTEKLEPCPFCQSHDVYVRKIGTHGESNAVRCRGCGCHGPLRATPADALASWNTRPPLAVSETPPDERAVLAETLAKCRDQFQFYVDEHEKKYRVARDAFEDARYWRNVSDQEKARVERDKRSEQTKTNRAFVEMIDAALSTHPEPSPDEHPANSAGQWLAAATWLDDNNFDLAASALTRKIAVDFRASLPGTTPTETAQQDSGEVAQTELLDAALSNLERVIDQLERAGRPQLAAIERDYLNNIKAAALTPSKPVDTDTGEG